MRGSESEIGTKKGLRERQRKKEASLKRKKETEREIKRDSETDSQ